MALSATFSHGAKREKPGFFKWAEAVIAGARKFEAQYRATQKEIAMAMSATVPHVADVAERAEKGVAKRGFFSRLLAFIIEAREREAERKIAQLAERYGGTMSDQLERDIDRYAL